MSPYWDNLEQFSVLDKELTTLTLLDTVLLGALVVGILRGSGDTLNALVEVVLSSSALLGVGALCLNIQSVFSLGISSSACGGREMHLRRVRWKGPIERKREETSYLNVNMLVKARISQSAGKYGCSIGPIGDHRED